MNKIQLKRLLIVFLVLACIAAIIEILLLISLLISLTSYIETIFAFIILIGLILEFLYVLKLIVVWVIKGKQMIDKDHAPEGYYAVKEEKKNSCVGCDFYRPVEICSKSKFCMAGSRPDDTNVILKKKENYMSKIYSAVDAEDAEHLIGKEVYCGDTLTGIKEHGKKGVLKSILYGYNNFRFLVDGLSMDNWDFIQEVETIEKRRIL